MDLGRVDIAMMSVYLIQGYNLTLNLFNFYLVHFNKILDLFSMTSRLPLWLTQGKESPCNAGDLGSIPGLGRSSREGNSYHSSILVWRIPWTEEPGRLHGVGKSQTQQHEFHFHSMT